jgi:uncharacterized membrane protein
VGVGPVVGVAQLGRQDCEAQQGDRHGCREARQTVDRKMHVRKIRDLGLCRHACFASNIEETL